MGEVEIIIGQDSVSIKAEGTVDEIAERALRLWRDSRDPRDAKAFAASGFSQERLEVGTYLPPHEGIL